MALPDFPSFFFPALRVFADGNPHGLKEVREQAAQAFQLDAWSRALLLSDGRTPVSASRIDGRQLAELMIDHDVCVTVVQTYKRKRLESDSFEQ